MNDRGGKITVKELSLKSVGLNIPQKYKKYLIGSMVEWVDNNPLGQEFEDLHYYFNSPITQITAILLRKYGLFEVAQTINVNLHWGIKIELVYDMPNRKENEKEHTEPHYFEFFGTLSPVSEKFIKERDQFYLLKNMEFSQVPDDHKNKKFYSTTKFTATVIGC